MKTILLPTDFTLQSLLPVHKIAADFKEDNCTILAVHMLEAPTSISELLFIGRTNHHQRVPVKFTEALQLLSNKYKAHGIQIKFQFIYCASSAYLKNFIEANNVDEVCLLDNYKYECAFKDSSDLNHFVKKCRAKISWVPAQAEPVFGFQNLSVLLQGNQQPVTELANESTFSYR